MEHSYSKLLSLVYFKTQGKDYDLSELCAILGLTQLQLDILISDLFEEGFLKYVDYEMCISQEGLEYLEQNNAINNKLKANSMNLSVINPKKAKSFDYIYIPKDFHKKV